MAVTDDTVESFTETLTGFDEIAIEKHMGIDVYMEAEHKPIKAIRALVFVHRTRAGDKPNDARKHALDLPFREVNDYFTDGEADDSDDDEPVTEMGKEGP